MESIDSVNFDHLEVFITQIDTAESLHRFGEC